MTDAERRSLKSYLTGCLEPARKYHGDEWERLEKVKSGASGLDAELVGKMHIYHKGKAEAFQSAIADFKELFAEELNEQED